MTKRLEDFQATSMSEDGFYLVCRLYPSVTFSETRTFDLMRLLYAYRKASAKTLYYFKSLIEVGVTNEQIKGHVFEPYFLFLKENGRLPEGRYIKALKAELAKREGLSRHEKRAAKKLKYAWAWKSC